MSRRGVDHTARFPDIAVAAARLPAKTLILDGEVAVFDEKLVSPMHLPDGPPPDAVFFLAFDRLILAECLRVEP